MTLDATLSPVEAFKEVNQATRSIKGSAEQHSANFAASGANFLEIMKLLDRLVNTRTQLNAVKNTAGLSAYAKTQRDQNYEIVTEIDAVVSAVTTAGLRIRNDLPKDGDDWLQVLKVNPDATWFFRSFSAAELTNLRTDLDAIVAAVTV